ncbi:hypothetical protein FRC10_009011 [Ceratobasidium sp. 414]|nr:hypothetical protein FRC10_009011 [Ceratobasidium sp. 414]
MLKLSDLPSDIYTTILSHIPPPDRQQAVLNLSRALPRSPVPTHQIYEHIIIHTPHAVLDLYHIFRTTRRGQEHQQLYNPSSRVKSICVRTWAPDADLVANLLALLPNVPVVQLCVGTTYGPEHLQEIFVKPRLELRSLQLRFRPYVKQATYLPFLKGAYFDSSIVELTKWPATEHNHLENLSITQDTISYKAHIQFAQPLAFFSFKVLTDLATSPIGQHISALRVSVPAKPVASYLCSEPNSFPRLTFLDISTTSLPPPSAERGIEKLLSQLIRLRHIVVDRNAGTMPRDSPGWTSLGRACALAGVGRAKAREKEIQEWFEARRREEAVVQAANPEQAAVAERAVGPTLAPRVRRGRKGLATATISLRDPQPQPRRVSASTSTAARNTPQDQDAPDVRRIRIVPSPPTLETFSTAFAGPSNPTSQQRADWTNAFTTGFLDGCRTLNAIWKRMQDSATARIMRFIDTDAEPYPHPEDEEDVLQGVADVAVVGHWIGWEPTIPIVCFGTERAAGVERMTMDVGDSPAMTLGADVTGPTLVGGLWEDEVFVQWGPGHVDGCGHNIGRDTFEGT